MSAPQSDGVPRLPSPPPPRSTWPSARCRAASPSPPRAAAATRPARRWRPSTSPARACSCAASCSARWRRSGAGGAPDLVSSPRAGRCGTRGSRRRGRADAPKGGPARRRARVPGPSLAWHKTAASSRRLDAPAPLAIRPPAARRSYSDAAKYRDLLAELEKRSKQAAAAASEWRSAAPLLRLGQRVVHRASGYRGAVVGWDAACCEDEEWVGRSGAGKLEGGLTWVAGRGRGGGVPSAGQTGLNHFQAFCEPRSTLELQAQHTCLQAARGTQAVQSALQPCPSRPAATGPRDPAAAAPQAALLPRPRGREGLGL
jgi:hypothetical protein